MGWWRWALVSPDGVAPSQMVSVSASVNLPLHHKVQKFSSGTGSPGWSQKKGHKMVVVVVVSCLWYTGKCVCFCCSVQSMTWSMTWSLLAITKLLLEVEPLPLRFCALVSRFNVKFCFWSDSIVMC